MYPPPLRRRSQPYLFPRAQSTVLPNPSVFFAPDLLNKPLPSNSFFQNYVLNSGEQPEYIHPYLIRSSDSKLTICYPKLFKNPAHIYQVFVSDLTISTKDNPCPKSRHVVSAFSDLSVTLDFPACNLKYFLVRGSPFLTCAVGNSVEISMSTVHDLLELSPNESRTKYVIKFKNNQVWLLYSSSPIYLSLDGINKINSDVFVGVIRIAALPNGSKKYEHILDKYNPCYPVNGDAYFTRPYCLEYRWDKIGLGDLLMLAHPLHLKLLSESDGPVTVLDDFKYDSIDGELVGVVGDTWVLKTDPISVTWHSINGINEYACSEIIESLVKDVEKLDSSSASKSTSASYSYGKLIARAARLALIAEEVSYVDVIPAVKKFLKEMIEPWLNGTFGPNGFFYESKWGGIVTKHGLQDSNAEHGFGIYNNHHWNLGYFVYGIAVLSKIDPTWGRKYKSKSYALMADYMNLSTRENTDYTRLRCFDLWKLHSWSAGLKECADGRNQQSTGDSVNAYYAAALMGLVHGDIHLASIASTLTALEIKAAQTWCHVNDIDTMHPDEFTKENRLLGLSFACKRSAAPWFAPASMREVRLGIHLLPILPISEVLYSDVGFVRELVNWAWTALSRGGVEEGWKGFVYALQGIYDREGALHNARRLNGYDNGNSRTNLLWWIYSRECDNDDDDGREEFNRGKKCSWFRHYAD